MPRRVRASEKITRSSPSVAITSEKGAPGARCASRCRSPQREHHVRRDRARHASDDLRRDVCECVAPPQAPEAGVDERDDGIEVRAGNRAEHEDEREEANRGRRSVLEQLQADVIWRQFRGGDPRADHRGREEGRTEKLGEETPSERSGHRRPPTQAAISSFSANSLAARRRQLLATASSASYSKRSIRASTHRRSPQGPRSRRAGRRPLACRPSRS